MNINGESEFTDSDSKTQNIDSTIPGETDFIGIINADAFITNGGTAAQFVKGNGALDSTTYITNPSLVDFEISGASLITNFIVNDDL